MSRGFLLALDLPRVAVPGDARVAAAAAVLGDSCLAAVAVVDADGRVVGLFTEDDLLRALVPRYLGELRHTASLDDVDGLVRPGAADERVTRHMSRSATVADDSSMLHVAEVFLHTDTTVVAVVAADGTFRAMLPQANFCRALLEETAGA